MKTIILKNTTVSDIYVLTRLITALDQDDFSTEKEADFRRDNDLLTLIASGDIVVNDGTDDLDFEIGQSYVSGSILLRDSGITSTLEATGLNFRNNLSVTDDGAGKFIVDAGGLTVVTTYAGLPGSPSTNDIVLYSPFNSTLTYDGTDWVGPKMISPLFGREGTGNGDSWIQAIGRASAYPTSGVTHGYNIPNITVGGGSSDWKIYNMSISTRNTVTGDMELHVNATAANPTYGVTGVVSIPIVASQTATADVTPTKVAANNVMQCYFRRTSGGWKAWTILVTYSLVAAA